MADNINYEELEQQLSQSRQELDRFGTALRGSSNSSGILGNANKAATAAINDEIAARKNLISGLASAAEEITNTTLSTGKNLASGQSNFAVVKGVVGLSIKAVGGLASTLGGLVPGIGGGLSKIADATTKAAIQMSEVIIDQFTVGWDAYRNLADTGTVRSFGELSELATSSGLRFEQLSATLGKYSTVLATYNSNLNNGLDGFKKLTAESKTIKGDMYKIGINAQEFTEFQLQYIGEQTRLGGIKRQTDKQLAQGTKQYIENLDTQAKLFGLSRKEQQQNRDIALSEDKFRAALDNVSDEISDPEKAKQIKDSALNLSNILQKTAPTVAGGIRELFAGRGAATGDLSRTLEVQTGGLAGKIALALRRGEIDEYEARNRIIDAIEKQKNKTQHIAQYTNDNAVATAYAQAADLVAQGKLTKQQIDDAAKSRNIVDAQTNDLADASKKLEHSSQKLQTLATSSDVASAAIRKASEGIETVADKLNQMFGNSSTKVVPKSSSTRSIGADSGASTASLPDIGAPPVPGPAVQVAGPAEFGGYLTADDVLIYGRDSGSKANFDKLNTEFKARVVQAAQEYYDLTGGKKKIKINSAFRDPKKQQELYDAWVEGGKKGRPVAKPGRSRHERGLAVDIQNYNDPMAIQAFNKFGLYKDVPNDKVHFQARSARTGGIFKEPNNSKYEIELHGDEVVADVVGNKIQNPFTSREKIQILKRLASMTGDRLDLMIDALSSTTGTQRKLVAATI